jgi:L-asparaginase II
VSVPLAEVTRGPVVESVHAGVVVVADAAGRVVAAAGDPEHVCFFRSCAKPFQTIPLVASGAADAFALSPMELAICCASHNGTPAHQALVAGILAKIGLTGHALHCGFSPPFDEREAARIALGFKPRSPIECECSGEHVGMLATCVHLGYPIETYTEAAHPLQRQIRAIVAAVTRVPEAAIALGTDGCGIPTFAAPIRAFAAAYAILAAPDRVPDGAGREYADAMDRLRAAMAAHPENVAGAGELDTDLMEVSGGVIIAKAGAEGLLCLALPERGLGVAIRAVDGSRRAHQVTAAHVLRSLDLAPQTTIDALRERQPPTVTNFAGTPVGEMRAVFTLHADADEAPSSSL